MLVRSYMETKIENKHKDGIVSITKDDLFSMNNLQCILDTMIQKWSIDRGVIYQYHNGGKFINGISMKKYSMTYEAIAPGIERIKEASQNQFLSSHPYMMKRLSEDPIIIAERGKNNEEFLNRRLEDLAIEQLIVLPIKNSKNTLIGELSFHTILHPIKITKNLKEDLIQTSKKISLIIQKK